MLLLRKDEAYNLVIIIIKWIPSDIKGVDIRNDKESLTL